jgi:hypothetical protein
MTATIDWTGFMSPREKREFEKEKNAPSPMQKYTPDQWRALDDAQPKVLTPQSDFERNYDRMPDGIKRFITGKWEATEDE